MSIQDTDLKKLPYSVSKKQLTALYLVSGMTERQIRKGINEIISEKRNIPIDKVTVRNVWHCELMEFVEVYGLPKGYELNNNNEL